MDQRRTRVFATGRFRQIEALESDSEDLFLGDPVFLFNIITTQARFIDQISAGARHVDTALKLAIFCDLSGSQSIEITSQIL